MRRLLIDVRDKTLLSFQQQMSLPFMGSITHWWVGTTLLGKMLSIYREREELEVRLNGDVIFHASHIKGLLSSHELLKYFDLKRQVEEREEKAS